MSACAICLCSEHAIRQGTQSMSLRGRSVTRAYWTNVCRSAVSLSMFSSAFKASTLPGHHINQCPRRDFGDHEPFAARTRRRWSPSRSLRLMLHQIEVGWCS